MHSFLALSKQKSPTRFREDPRKNRTRVVRPQMRLATACGRRHYCNGGDFTTSRRRVQLLQCGDAKGDECLLLARTRPRGLRAEHGSSARHFRRRFSRRSQARRRPQHRARATGKNHPRRQSGRCWLASENAGPRRQERRARVCPTLGVLNGARVRARKPPPEREPLEAVVHLAPISALAARFGRRHIPAGAGIADRRASSSGETQ